jgi:hypothetical protein
MGILQFYQSTVDGLLYCLQVKFIIKNASENIFVSCCTCMYFCVHLGVKLLGLRAFG